MLGVLVWGALVLWYHAPLSVRWLLLGGWIGSGLVALIAPAPCRRPGRFLFALLALAVVLLWLRLTPSHHRDWADEVAQMLEAELEGSQLTLHQVRNFRWRSPEDYDIRWETRRYDLDQLVSGDLLLSYWMGPAIAHTLVSFGFADGRQLVFSLEIRKERHEAFSAVAGFFRQYEAILVAAEENDIVRVRTNARGETVRMYRLALTPEQLRTALLGYLQVAEDLRRQPRFYNTLTSNCTTMIYQVARLLDPGLPLDYRLLLSGWFDRYARDHHGLLPGHSFEELAAAADITDQARAFDGPDRDFSTAIRRGLPGSTPSP